MNDKHVRSGEDRLIDRFFRPLAKHPGAFNFVDDAASISPPPGCDLVLTADAIVEGVHFLPDDPADAVAMKALRVNLSDLAAKGAEPLGALMTIALPGNFSESWLAGFARGLDSDCDRFNCPLLGGDTTSTTGALMLSIMALGSVPAGKMIRRGGAREGDAIAVTGTIGDAALGLALCRNAATFAKLSAEEREHLVRRRLVPEPRVALARAIRDHASAAIDISDGLAGDVGKLAAASGVAAGIEAARVPLSASGRAAIKADPALIETVLTGGDDYEVALTLPESRRELFFAAAEAAGVPVTTIGRIERGEGTEVAGADGRVIALRRPSYSHF
jgi:thiamine-monophosphate kinase